MKHVSYSIRNRYVTSSRSPCTHACTSLRSQVMENLDRGEQAFDDLNGELMRDSASC
jgi:hypothetical protein